MPHEIRSKTQNVAGIKDEPNESPENQPPEKDTVEDNGLESELEASKLEVQKLQSKLQNLEDIAKIDAQAMEDWKSTVEELKEENFNYLKQLNDMRTKNDALQKQVDDYQKRIQTTTAHNESLVKAVKELASSKSAREQSENELLHAAKKLQNIAKEMERKVCEQNEEYDRILQQHLDKKSAEIQTQKRSFNLLKNADGYDPAQDEEDEEEVVILGTVGQAVNVDRSNNVLKNVSTEAKKEKLTIEELKKLCPPKELFKHKRNTFNLYEVPWIAKIFFNLPQIFKNPSGKYISKCWKKFKTELTSIGRTDKTFYHYYRNGPGGKHLKKALEQLNNGIDPSKFKKSGGSSGSDSDDDDCLFIDA